MSWGNKDFANNEPQYLQTNIPGNTNLYMVTDTRLANASFGNGKGVAHTGWVKINQGTGFVAGIAVSNVNPANTYANGWVTFSGANTTPANARILVLGGNNVSVILNTGGEGYLSIPTATASAGANNANLVFTIIPGGRMGRVQPEVLVALSEETALDTNSGLPYFTGV